jgi:ElaB/YqjD/DUF883 family membrane-anchored ribosome-binding protein
MVSLCRAISVRAYPLVGLAPTAIASGPVEYSLDDIRLVHVGGCEFMPSPEEQISSQMQAGDDPMVQALLSDVDEFLGYIAIVKTPDVDAVREVLDRSLRHAKYELLTALNRSRLAGPRRAARPRAAQRPAARNLVSIHPWVAICTAAVLGATIGTLARMGGGHKAR